MEGKPEGRMGVCEDYRGIRWRAQDVYMFVLTSPLAFSGKRVGILGLQKAEYRQTILFPSHHCALSGF